MSECKCNCKCNGENEQLRKYDNVCKIIEANDRNPSRLIPILQQIQHQYGYLPQEVLAYVATSLDVPPARVYGVASFYGHFALEPKGKYIIRLCDGTACHVKGTEYLLEALRKRLNLAAGKTTTADMMFTVETVSCLGACGLAPVLTINDKVYGLQTPEKTVALVEEILAKEGK